MEIIGTWVPVASARVCLFIALKVVPAFLEAREADLLQNMGLPVENPDVQNRIVVKYYIRFLVRNELYIGPVWDAHPDWRVSLENFLRNLK